MPTPARIKKPNLPSVVIAGHVNVGKSTLFNRLTEKQGAIVSPIPGTTRTRNEGAVLWRGREFRLVDTGGLPDEESAPFAKELAEQVEQALSGADLVILMVEAGVPLQSAERAFATRLRRIGIPTLLAVNKTDTQSALSSTCSEPWARLGLGDPLFISAKNGRGVGELLDRAMRLLGRGERRPKTPPVAGANEIRVAIIGKPNVGKSSLFNALIGEARVIVSPIAHTTREPYNTSVIYEEAAANGRTERHEIVFVDTAGIRRKARVSGDIERQGVGKSIAAAKDANIVLLVLDAAEPISDQDRQLGALLVRQKNSVIMLVNKWDMTRQEKNPEEVRKDIDAIVRARFPHLSFAPILYVSAKTLWRVHDIFPAIIRAWQARNVAIPEAAIEAARRFAVSRHLPVRGKGTRHPRVMTMRQLGENPPVFEVVVRHGASLHHSYLDYLERVLREQCDFFATPLTLFITKLKR